MFREEFDIDTEVLDSLRNRMLQDFPTVLSGLNYEPVLQYMQQEVDERLVPYPGPVRYPIEWKSEKQRRYVMGFVLERDSDGEIIPYQRTYGLQRKWDVRLEGGAIVIVNTSEIGRYVFGEDQQPFHANTGWPYAPDIVYDILVDAPVPDLISAMIAEYFNRD